MGQSRLMVYPGFALIAGKIVKHMADQSKNVLINGRPSAIGADHGNRWTPDFLHRLILPASCWLEGCGVSDSGFSSVKELATGRKQRRSNGTAFLSHQDRLSLDEETRKGKNLRAIAVGGFDFFCVWRRSAASSHRYHSSESRRDLLCAKQEPNSITPPSATTERTETSWVRTPATDH